MKYCEHYESDSVSVCQRCGIGLKLVHRLRDCGFDTWGQVKAALNTVGSKLLSHQAGIGAASMIVLSAVCIAKKMTTPASEAKAAGLTSLAQVAKLTGVSPQTLDNWHKSEKKQDLFRIVLQGCAVDPSICPNAQKYGPGFGAMKLLVDATMLDAQAIGRATRLSKGDPVELDYQPVEIGFFRARSVLMQINPVLFRMSTWMITYSCIESA